jgi:hypothetical protein
MRTDETSRGLEARHWTADGAAEPVECDDRCDDDRADADRDPRLRLPAVEDLRLTGWV